MPGEQEETYVVLPADRAKSDGINVLVEDEGEGDDEVEDGEALGTEAVGKNLEGVGVNQGREGDVVRGVKQKDEGDDSVRSGVALGDGVTSRTDGLEGEEEQHANARRDEKDSSSDTFGEQGASDGP